MDVKINIFSAVTTRALGPLWALDPPRSAGDAEQAGEAGAGGDGAPRHVDAAADPREPPGVGGRQQGGETRERERAQEQLRERGRDRSDRLSFRADGVAELLERCSSACALPAI